jgi:TolB-like protein/class 3 adenylate cyclase/tetratricopeptide (TPR) repeat protein
MQSDDLPRRRVAIFAADVAGYSRLVGLDETGTHRRLKALRAELLEALVHKHQGRIVNYAGDGVLAEFSSAACSVACAVELQQAAAEREPELPPDRRMALRIGLHLGDVLADDDSIYGDAVNVAARLEQLAEPGGICLSDRVYSEIAGRVELTCSYGGEPPLKNIGRPIGTWFWPTDQRAGVAPRLLPPADRPSIAVLPFKSLGAPDDSLADGVVEDVTTALARLSWLFVVARTSAFALKGQQIDARDAGRRLGVRYLLEGSVRYAQEQVRISGQLIDAGTGTHLWADHFDDRPDNLLDLQDRITTSIVAAIEPNLLSAEAARTRLTRPGDLRAHHYYLRAVGLMASALADPEGETFDEARFLLERAIELDGHYAPALALAAFFEIKASAFGRVSDDVASDERAISLAERAVRADSQEPLALGVYGFVRANVRGELYPALDLVQRGLSLNPSSALLWNFLGEVQIYVGEHDRAIECFYRSIRLNPLDQRTTTNSTYLAFAHLFRRESEEAVRWATRAVVLAPNPVSYRALAASLADAGRIDEARAAAAEVLRLQPNACLRRSRESAYRRAEDLALYVDALRKAGLPEEPTGELATSADQELGARRSPHRTAGR